VVATAPLREAVAGIVELDGEGTNLSPARSEVNLRPGERAIRFIGIQPAASSTPGLVRATLTMKDRVLRGQVPIIGRKK